MSAELGGGGPLWRSRPRYRHCRCRVESLSNGPRSAHAGKTLFYVGSAEQRGRMPTACISYSKVQRWDDFSDHSLRDPGSMMVPPPGWGPRPPSDGGNPLIDLLRFARSLRMGYGRCQSLPLPAYTVAVL